MKTSFCTLCGVRIVRLAGGEWVHKDTGIALDLRPSPALGGGMLAGHYAEPPARFGRAIQLPKEEGHG